jgi:hypothetical protein
MYIMTNQIIGSVLCTPGVPSVGESVLVQVLSPNNIPYKNYQEAYISINGITGSRQYLQFKRQGQQKIRVFASHDGEQEITEINISVKQSDTTYPILRASKSKYEHYSVIFSLIEQNTNRNYFKHVSELQEKTINEVNYVKDQLSTVSHLAGELGAGIPVVVKLSSKEILHKLGLPLQQKSKLLGDLGKNIEETTKKIEHFSSKWSKMKDENTLNSARTIALSFSRSINELRSNWKIYNPDKSTHNTKTEKQKVNPSSGSGIPVINYGYLWQFGDGQWLHTQDPVVTHDFADSLQPNKLYHHFDISVTNGWTGTIVRRTLAIVNVYKMGKDHGFIHPKVSSDFKAKRLGSSYVSNFIIKNVENFALQLDHKRVIVMNENPDEDSMLLPVEHTSLTIPASGAKIINVEIPANRIPNDSPGFSVHYSGQIGSTKIRVSAYFEIPEHGKKYTSPFLPAKEFRAIDKRPWIVEDPSIVSDLYSLDLVEKIIDLNSFSPVLGSQINSESMSNIRPTSVEVQAEGGM